MASDATARFDSRSAGPYHARAMGNPLRDRRTAAEWASAGQAVEISEKIGSFGQLAAIVEADLAALEADRIPAAWRDSAVNGTLKFGFADARQTLPAVECRISLAVDAVCQRCLEPFRLPLEVEASLLLLAFEQTADGYDEYEVWELEENTLRPLDIVEELLILALPFAAMHVESAACEVLTTEAEPGEDTTRPFAALREQMTEEH